MKLFRKIKQKLSKKPVRRYERAEYYESADYIAQGSNEPRNPVFQEALRQSELRGKPKE